jgi:putative flippase GtrA
MTKLKEIFISPQFLKFILLGCVNTFNTIAFSFLYANFLHVNLAFALGYFTSLAIAYVLNSFVTFKKPLALKTYGKFCISYIPNFIVQNLVVFVVYNILAWYEIVAFILAAIVVLPMTFLILKLFAFKKDK